MPKDFIAHILSNPESLKSALQALSECTEHNTVPASPQFPSQSTTSQTTIGAQTPPLFPKQPDARKLAFLSSIKQYVSSIKADQIDHAIDLCELTLALKNQLADPE